MSPETPTRSIARPEAPAGQAEAAASRAFRTVLAGLRGPIPDTLIDGAGWARVRSRVEGLPVDAGSMFGFEFHLADPAPEADFCLSLLPGGSLVRHWIRHGRTAGADPAEAGLARYLAATDEAACRGKHWSSVAFLEYDAAEAKPGTSRVPGVFLKLRSASGDALGAGAAAPPEVVAETLAAAVGWTPDAGERRALTRACGALAAVGRTCSQVGAMPGRSRRVVKLVTGPLAAADAAELLERLQWPGPVRTVTALLSALGGLFSALRISCDLTPRGLLPRLGLELYREQPDGVWEPGSDGWQPLLARLRERGWCLPAKADGLLAWPGLEKIFSRHGLFLVHTGVNHVKITVDAGQRGAEPAIGAKAYAAASYMPFDFATRGR